MVLFIHICSIQNKNTIMNLLVVQTTWKLVKENMIEKMNKDKVRLRGKNKERLTNLIANNKKCCNLKIKIKTMMKKAVRVQNEISL